MQQQLYRQGVDIFPLAGAGAKALYIAHQLGRIGQCDVSQFG
jgi:hypothetical protein